MTRSSLVITITAHVYYVYIQFVFENDSFRSRRKYAKLIKELVDLAAQCVCQAFKFALISTICLGLSFSHAHRENIMWVKEINLECRFSFFIRYINETTDSI